MFLKSTKVSLPLRKWGSVDLKKVELKENTTQKKSKSSILSQNQASIGNTSPEDKKNKAKVAKKGTVARATTSNLSESAEAASSRLTSTSSARSSILTAKPSKRKMSGH
ncbi:unnamed protein product [Onchocerca flexuosa]|uniref:Ovule protein n=1 Tax=Onchocerca flexuosa TaxID=387005 RepID=A0A183HJ04_9BILA|nr:unnamed protein product [Onchocerca flexuosa]